jgi:OPA family sugar phosphate sensor protein UhpC-like MFS transporter
VLRFFASGPDRPLASRDPGDIRRRYERMRWSVFLSVTFGYGFFYVARINFSVVKDPLLRERLLDPGQMGLVGSALLVVYAGGRLINGFLADRANIRRFMSAALLLSAAVNWLLGLTRWGFATFLVAWALNGWFQSVGSAPSVVALSHWFGRKERGTRYGIWSASHSIGEAITFAGTGVLVASLGWRAGFLGPGLVCGLVALILFRTLADRPQTYGLPPVWEYRGEEPEAGRAARSVGRSQLEVIRHPAVWVLALSSACMYVARYGMSSWGALFFRINKGYSLKATGGVLAVYPIAEIAGSVSSGFISDRFFGSRRNLPALLLGLLEVGSMLLLYKIPPGHPLLDGLALVGFGYALGGLLVYLGGLMAVDLVPQRAAGAAMGVIGVFSYLGAAIQDTVSGYLTKATGRPARADAGLYDLGPAFRFWIGSAILSVLLALLTWRARPRGTADDAAVASGNTVL